MIGARPRTTLEKYAGAVAFVTIAAAADVILPSRMGLRYPALLFHPAVLLSAWFGGFGPGLLYVSPGPGGAMPLGTNGLTNSADPSDVATRTRSVTGSGTERLPSYFPVQK